MIRIFLIAVFGLAILTTAPVAAEEPSQAPSESTAESTDAPAAQDEESSRHFGADHRREMYESGRLQTRNALLYSLALPGLGNFYAEQYALGTVVMTALVFSGIFIGFGLVNSHPSVLRLGLITTGLTYTTGAISSYIGVRQYNDELRRSLHIDKQAMQLTNMPTWTVGYTWRF